MSRQPETQENKKPDIGGGVAIISGDGVLPQLLAEECARQGVNFRVVVFTGTVPDWASGFAVIRATFEKLGNMFRDIRASGCTSVTFAGGMLRPRIDLSLTDVTDIEVISRMQDALRQGDDATLRFFAGLFEEQHLKIFAPQAILSGLVAQPGNLTERSPSLADKADTARAAEIVRALGAVDVGQGAVVAQGICLAVESIQGTDRMLAFVAEGKADLLPDPNGARGILFKAAKPGQDRRMDLPSIGPDTMRAAAMAGLAGVVVEAGGAFILERETTIAEADRLGLFLWSRDGADG